MDCINATQANEGQDSNRFLRSALTLEGEYCTCEEALDWIRRRAAEVHVAVKYVGLDEMPEWAFDKAEGRIRHVTGRFFSIDGILVNTSVGAVTEWRQPIINQPEIGFLGCIVREYNQVLYFLVQAKIEPGNINIVQISPTLQATRSNYTQQHAGSAPKYLDYFNGRRNSRVLVDQLQSEQGARFLGKRNRNIIVEVEEDLDRDDDFRWLTLGQIKKLCRLNNIVNMDLRTVISAIQLNRCDLKLLSEESGEFRSPQNISADFLRSAFYEQGAYFSLDQSMSWLTELKSVNHLATQKIPIEQLGDWKISQEGIFHKAKKYFSVRWVSVEIENREKAKWTQPIIEPQQEGLIAFVIKKINGKIYFLTQAKMECGNRDIFELAPTVQCITGSYKNSEKQVPYLKYVLEADESQVLFKTMLSEEGGRFYHEQNLNLIIEADEFFPTDTPPRYRWMTLNELLRLIRYNHYVNIQARSLISCLNFG